MFVDEVTDCTFSVLSSLRCSSFLLRNSLYARLSVVSYSFPKGCQMPFASPEPFSLRPMIVFDPATGGSQKLRWRDQSYSMTNGFRVPCSSEDLT